MTTPHVNPSDPLTLLIGESNTGIDEFTILLTQHTVSNTNSCPIISIELVDSSNTPLTTLSPPVLYANGTYSITVPTH